jgi:uncharacterized protein (DUF2147 family)
MVLMALPATAACPVEGAWAVQDLILEIYQCQDLVCGRVAWVKDPNDARWTAVEPSFWGLSPSGPETWG